MRRFRLFNVLEAQVDVKRATQKELEYGAPPFIAFGTTGRDTAWAAPGETEEDAVNTVLEKIRQAVTS